MFSAKTSDKTMMPAMPAASRSNGQTAMPSLISQFLSVTGDLASDGDVQVDGVVDGNVKTASLTIGESGSIKGAVSAENVRVAGTLDGQIRARTVTLTRTARVRGDIWHESLAIEAGAQFEGTCRRLDEAGARAEPLPSLGRSSEEGDGAYARSAGAALSD